MRAVVEAQVRRYERGGIVATVAGNGMAGYTGDAGAATAAKLALPTSMAVDSSGNLYVPDYYNNRMHKVDTSGHNHGLCRDWDHGRLGRRRSGHPGHAGLAQSGASCRSRATRAPSWLPPSALIPVPTARRQPGCRPPTRAGGVAAVRAARGPAG
jgi:hypothetical protein